MSDKEAKLREMSKEAREARRAYDREYYRRNPDKQREKARRYWERKAARADAESLTTESLEVQNASKAAFAKRFKEEMERKGLKGAYAQLVSLVDAGILKAEATSSTIRNYWNARTWPDINNLIKLADFFGVSLDYLTGRSDLKTIDADISITSETIGLSEETIELLIKMKKDWPFGTAMLDAMLRNTIMTAIQMTQEYEEVSENAGP